MPIILRSERPKLTSANILSFTDLASWHLSTICAVLGMWVACLGLVAASATAAWLPAIAVHGPAVEQVAFDSRDVPWAAFDGGAPYPALKMPVVARLTNRFQLIDRHRIPVVAGDETNVIGLELNASEAGDVLLQLEPRCACHAPPTGVAVAPWRPGKAPGRPLILTSEVSRGPSMAINADGVAAVLWATAKAVEVDRVKGVQLLGDQEIRVEDGHIPNSAEVLPSPTGGFLSSWELRAGGQSESEFDLVGVDSDEARRNGLLSTPVFTPWPAQNLLGFNGVSEAKLVSDVRGDQVLVWDEQIGYRPGTETDLYVASRRAGRPFSAPQFLGESVSGNYGVQIAMSAVGRITLIWNPTVTSKLRVAGGYAGHRLSAPSPLWPASSGLAETEPRLVVTPRGLVIALWATRRGEYGAPTAASSVVEAATSVNGVTFTAPRRISIDGHDIHGCDNPRLLTLDHTGGALAGWSCRFHRHESVNEYARYRP